jgi:hypothetical protein
MHVLRQINSLLNVLFQLLERLVASRIKGRWSALWLPNISSGLA